MYPLILEQMAEESSDKAKLRNVLKRNKTLRMHMLKKNSELENEKKENLKLLKTINNMEMQIKNLRSGDEIIEQKNANSKLKQRYKNLERLFNKEKDEGLRLKSENQKLVQILKKGNRIN
jgi:alpha-glucuronidase